MINMETFVPLVLNRLSFDAQAETFFVFKLSVVDLWKRKNTFFIVGQCEWKRSCYFELQILQLQITIDLSFANIGRKR